MKRLKRKIIFTLFICGILFLLFNPKGIISYFFLDHQFSVFKEYKDDLLKKADSLLHQNKTLTNDYNIEKIAREKFRFIYPKEKIIIYKEK